MAYKGLVCAALMLVMGGNVVGGGADQDTPDVAKLQAMNARFAPVDIGAVLSALPESERQALAKLVQAGRLMDAKGFRGSEVQRFRVQGSGV